MRITIAANMYPPEIGGPSEYSRQLYETLLVQNQYATVVTYGSLKKFTTGIRHFLYFCKLCIESYDSDYIIAMDTYSVGFPAVVFAKLLGKKIIVRVAGDFLWETYTERTHEKILLSEFYLAPRNFSRKEKIIFRLSRWVLQSVDCVVFSTDWQRDICLAPYRLQKEKARTIENFYSPIEAQTVQPSEKVFLSPSRDRFIKNKELLEEAFSAVRSIHSDITLDIDTVSREVLREKISRAYAVIVPSVSEVSPNLVLDALAYGVPAVVTYDTGIAERIKDMVVFVDPLSKDSIAKGIETLLDPTVYNACSHAILSQTFTHSWNEIVQEFLDLYKEI